MKIYVSDKEIKENNLVNNNSNEVVLTTYSWDLDDNQIKDEYPLKIKSLEQHEQEIRKQERQKVISELEKWASYKVRDYDTSLPRLEMINSFIKKLNEMKGE